MIKIKIGIIDADLIFNGKQRFPNLVCMKISNYHKIKGNSVKLITSYEDILEISTIFDKIYLSKVFTTTEVPEWVLQLDNVEIGGTGFYYDKAKSLPYEIEHTKPDYDLYISWVNNKINNGEKRKNFEYFLDYSIGFMTRGCIRQCSFCVNKNSKECVKHSSVYEFLDENKPYICLLDDNIFACKEWKSIFEELIQTKKRFQFKQGCDERLLTLEKCDYLFNKAKWIGDRIFEFDNIKDKDIIIDKLKMIRKITNKQIKFYVFCGYNHDLNGEYNEEFWKQDIINLFERIKILSEYGCLPYIMRHENYNQSPYRGLYINIASWCNQPSLFKSMTFSQYCKNRGMNNDKFKKYKNDFENYLKDGHKKGSSWRYLEEFENKYPDIAEKYFTMKGFKKEKIIRSDGI